MNDWWMPALAGLGLLNLLALVWGIARLAARQGDAAAAAEPLRQAVQEVAAAQRAQAELADRAARELRTELQDGARTGRTELQGTLATFQQTLLAQSGDVARTQNEQIDSFRTQLATLQQQVLAALAQSAAQQAAHSQAAREAQDAALRRQADGTAEALQRFGTASGEALQRFGSASSEALQRLSTQLTEQLRTQAEANERRLAEVRQTVEARLAQLQQGNEAKLEQMRATVDETFVHPSVAAYALDVIDVVRARANSQQPISPRAALGTVQLAKAHALAAGRDHVRPDDLQAVVVAALSHRIADATNDDLPTARRWIAEFLQQVPVPPMPGA